MLKVWFVIYSGMFIAGSAGPLPYSMDVCKLETRTKTEQLKKAIRTGIAHDGRKISKQERRGLLDIRYACIQSETRPLPDLPS